MKQLSTGFRRGHANVDDPIEAPGLAVSRGVQLREVVGRGDDLATLRLQGHRAVQAVG